MDITDATFDEKVVKGKGLVLVDFWAPWCGPCRALAPVLEDVAKELSGTVTIGKINVDENPTVSGQFSIMSIPTMILFKDGKVVAQQSGALSKPKLLDWIKSHV